MINEELFKEELIKILNNINIGWRDGDKDKFIGKKVDIVNDDLKIAIEVKDDIKYEMPLMSAPFKIISDEINLSNKNRQFKYDIKDANEKFINYSGYKSIVILRTDMSNLSKDIIEYTINGPKVIYIKNTEAVGVGRPSTFFGEHDNSTKEVGVMIFWGNEKFYRKNINPNVNKNRIIEKEELEKIMGFNLEYLNL